MIELLKVFLVDVNHKFFFQLTNDCLLWRFTQFDFATWMYEVFLNP